MGNCCSSRKPLPADHSFDQFDPNGLYMCLFHPENGSPEYRALYLHKGYHQGEKYVLDLCKSGNTWGYNETVITSKSLLVALKLAIIPLHNHQNVVNTVRQIYNQQGGGALSQYWVGQALSELMRVGIINTSSEELSHMQEEAYKLSEKAVGGSKCVVDIGRHCRQ
ncbi:hypothetical protein GLAREA_02187 [Glarea lozoyensis ATCC 20868]|uniref:Uncharacterized protein n=1 Tax=Glarea lozoyensis (strain ATCC 20868 / MF5171) TaxID=1116229 RepID=S3CKM4_GLAL2|nr:uncharacterized protein GLAREA_02187 [Glarea lozoyensis ATCC 20868]EPE26275.1 hypothetical protein GLAREA_02187 [Glarea lozoyensis ATCC 20868]